MLKAHCWTRIHFLKRRCEAMSVSTGYFFLLLWRVGLVEMFFPNPYVHWSPVSHRTACCIFELYHILMPMRMMFACQSSVFTATFHAHTQNGQKPGRYIQKSHKQNIHVVNGDMSCLYIRPIITNALGVSYSNIYVIQYI